MASREQLPPAPQASSSSAEPTTPTLSSSSNDPVMALSDFRLLSVLGEGVFGKVWFAHSLRTNSACAVKVIARTPIQSKPLKDGMTYFEREVDCMKRVDPKFPFIVRFFGHFSSGPHDFLAMEYLGCGDLFAHLVRFGSLPESHCKLYIAELGCALSHLHDRGIIYRDLKLENIMIGSDGHLKLIDLGVSKVMHGPTAKSKSGTLYTMAPEMLAGREYDFKVDFYALGVILFELVTGKPPFVKDIRNKPLFELRVIHENIRLPESCSDPCQSLLSQLLEKSPRYRLGTFKALLKHPWFKGYHPQIIPLKIYRPKYVPSSRKTLKLEHFEEDYEHPEASEYSSSPYPLSDVINDLAKLGTDEHDPGD